jgi:neurofibromin 1
VLLDEGLAKYLLAVVSTYAHIVSSDPTGPTAGLTSPAPKDKGMTGSTSGKWGKTLSPDSSFQGVGTRFIRQHSYPSPNDRLLEDTTPKLLAPLASTHARTVARMAKYTTRIVFYLSASNWPLVLSRLKTRINHLTTTIDENPDLVDLRILEWANVDRARLSQALQEIANVFLHVKRPAQIAIAIVLRRAIWNWILIHPAEYEALIKSDSKLEGGADALFDVLASMSDFSSSNAKRVRVFYPLMAMLLVICPDTFKRAIAGDTGSRSKGSSGQAKKVAYLESLRKGLAGNKAFETCASCYVDLVRAAVYLSPRYESAGVRSIVPEVINDLKVSATCC